LELGTAIGKASLTIADLDARPRSGPCPLTDRCVTNRARFIQSLGRDRDLRGGVVIGAATEAAVDRVAEHIDFDCDVTDFGNDRRLRGLFEELGLRLRSAAEARNHLRRARA